MDLKTQKRMASDIMDVGKDRVWIDPDEQEKVDEAITRNDIRNLIEGGAIQKKDEKGTSKGRAKHIKKQKKKGRRKGQGSRKGKKGARKSDKKKWMEKIRAIRERLKEMKEEGEVTSEQYRELYDMSKGGFFRDTKHLENHVANKLE
ncbi:50S ribosomal protein L19e [Candidatus Nanohalobium constans]|uniref:Large ribosomal subunit protein eL19 n=1 Tax=Candidatus Nanohalobium constans TaxID=2565781 RepID=A0A5Q0UHA5_9ARCH|nr:50S ribosomal protein L19e [Candidatus Nanohalobium constans]QGA80966.1 50S ribosomal protein L19e [Candidatus Nanohalobium constans]